LPCRSPRMQAQSPGNSEGPSRLKHIVSWNFHWGSDQPQ
jgi:hypothetical protein